MSLAFALLIIAAGRKANTGARAIYVLPTRKHNAILRLSGRNNNYGCEGRYGISAPRPRARDPISRGDSAEATRSKTFLSENGSDPAVCIGRAVSQHLCPRLKCYCCAVPGIYKQVIRYKWRFCPALGLLSAMHLLVILQRL